MPQTGIFSGKKVAKSHSSISPEVAELIEAAKKLTSVSKVVPGPLRARGGPRRVKFTVIPAGLRLLVQGGESVQTLYIYTTEPEQTQAALEAAFD